MYKTTRPFGEERAEALREELEKLKPYQREMTFIQQAVTVRVCPYCRVSLHVPDNFHESLWRPTPLICHSG